MFYENVFVLVDTAFQLISYNLFLNIFCVLVFFSTSLPLDNRVRYDYRKFFEVSAYNRSEVMVRLLRRIV